MARKLIVCVDKSAPSASGHRHIVGVGVSQNGERSFEDVTAVRARIRGNVDTYFTYGRTSEKVARVEAWDCSCGARTIRSHADAVADNNLDNLNACHHFA